MSTTYIGRFLLQVLHEKVQPGKVVLLLGARRVGKTELLKAFLETLSTGDFLFLNGEDQATEEILATRTQANYARLVHGKRYLVIDEAQKITDIGVKLKFLVDTFPELSIIATGSSVFDITQKMGEPLVGRQRQLRLFPLAQLELKASETLLDTRNKLEERLIFGGYPELEKYPNWLDKADYLEAIVNDYLLRDILTFNNLRKADKILSILRLIALQIGKEVSLDELSNSLKGISRNTIESYLDVLEKVFVVYRVTGFSRNLRKEVVKSNRWYFYDNGIRNAIIRNFSPLNLRIDKGELWENYCMAERLKYTTYAQRRINIHFWRTYDKQEIDLIEEENAQLSAYEFTWSASTKKKVPTAWANTYPEATYSVIHTENYLDFIGA